eukprot:TRINITY_DN5039_c0_g1_i1.p1 TRINITY_DN5039_c0_g1~~TRINITY_DN5039_c0_g1_i1.p1  ORF type:complete len:151 (-),score=30.05 TRINITY_DN5039_c0_g1_i1:220-672(-)
MSLADILGPQLLDGKETVSTDAALKNVKFVGLYFGAKWCPPCRAFTPKLAITYQEHLKGHGFEIVFCSADKEEAQFQEYYGGMPFKALPFDSPNKDALRTKFKLKSVPTLLVLDAASGKVITARGVRILEKDPTGGKLATGSGLDHCKVS